MKIFKYIAYVVVIWFIAHLYFTVHDGLIDHKTTAEVGVVFGNKVNPDGSLSPRLQARLDQAVTLYQQKRVTYLIASGGTGKEGIAEAEAMKSYLLEKGIIAQHIIVDNQGVDTESTVHNALSIMRQQGFKNAISISQYFHQARIKMLFNKAGLNDIESSSPKYFELRDVYSLVREFYAFYTDWLK